MKNLLKVFLISCVFLFYSNVFATFNFSHQVSTVKLNNARFVLSSNITNWDGTFDKHSGSVSGVGQITFDGGIFESGESKSVFNGTYDPDALQQILLTGSKTLRPDPGILSEKIYVYSRGNRLEGQPLFANSDGITLQDFRSTLTVAVQSGLSSNIVMNGGTIALGSDLVFKDDKNFTGSGIVDLNGYGIYFGGNDSALNDLHLTHTVTWHNAAQINLSGRTTLSGLWTFNTGETSVLNGHGNVLDLTHSGTIYLESGAILEMTDVVIKGLGLNKGWLAFQDATAQIKMSNVSVELDSRFYTLVGGIYVEGPTTFVVKNFNWTFDQAGSLTVDGITLWKDYGDQVATNPATVGDIKFGQTTASHRTYIDNGIIEGLGSWDQIKNNSNSIVSQDELIINNSNAIVSQDVRITNNSNAIVSQDERITNNSNSIVSQDVRITNNSNAIIKLSGTIGVDFQPQLNTIDHGPAGVHFIDNTVSLTYNIYLVAGALGGYEHKMFVYKPGNTVTVNGDGRYIHFSRETTSKLIDVSNDTTLVFQDVVLKDFRPMYMDLNSRGSVIFGDKTTIELAETCSVDPLYTMSFQGHVIINGYGHEFDINTLTNAMDVLQSATLTLENVNIVGLGEMGPYNLRCLDRFSTLEFRECDLMMTGNYTFSEGFLNVYQDVKLAGKNHVFTYQSVRPGTVNTNSMLLMDKDTTFRYDAGNSGWGIARKDAFILQDASSILYLNGCTLYSTRTGLLLDNGTMVVDDKVTLTSEALYQAEAVHLKDPLEIKVLGGANFNWYGMIKYE